MMDAQDEMTEHTMTVDIKYDYFKVNKGDGAAPPLMPA
jgi:hypothetical protein